VSNGHAAGDCQDPCSLSDINYRGSGSENRWRNSKLITQRTNE
jgi:hypothetical protein